MLPKNRCLYEITGGENPTGPPLTIKKDCFDAKMQAPSRVYGEAFAGQTGLYTRYGLRSLGALRFFTDGVG